MWYPYRENRKRCPEPLTESRPVRPRVQHLGTGETSFAARVIANPPGRAKAWKSMCFATARDRFRDAEVDRSGGLLNWLVVGVGMWLLLFAFCQESRPCGERKDGRVHSTRGPLRWAHPLRWRYPTVRCYSGNMLAVVLGTAIVLTCVQGRAALVCCGRDLLHDSTMVVDGELTDFLLTSNLGSSGVSSLWCR